MPTLTKPRVLILALAAVLTLTAVYSLKVIKQGTDAYVFGYPLVLMELTRQAIEPGIGANNLSHMRVFPDHNFRQVPGLMFLPPLAPTPRVTNRVTLF